MFMRMNFMHSSLIAIIAPSTCLISKFPILPKAPDVHNFAMGMAMTEIICDHCIKKVMMEEDYSPYLFIIFYLAGRSHINLSMYCRTQKRCHI